jgi:hypothetical protein
MANILKKISEPSKTTKRKANNPEVLSGKRARSNGEGPSDVIENTLIKPQLNNKPYIFLSANQDGVQADRIKHVMGKFRNFAPTAVRADRTGYYIIFEDSEQGNKDALGGFEAFNGSFFFHVEIDLELVKRRGDDDPASE